MNSEITKSWLNSFPELGKHAKNKFYKILGPTIVGIELIKLPRIPNYRPHFVLYPLFGNDAGQDLKECLSFPIILQQFRDPRNLQYSIPYEDHSKIIPDIIKNVKKSVPLPLEGSVELNQLAKYFKAYSKQPPIGFSPNSYIQARLFEGLLSITVFCDDHKEIEDTLEVIGQKKWSRGNFESFKVDLDLWLDRVHAIPENRTDIVDLVSRNRENKKVINLVHSELTV